MADLVRSGLSTCKGPGLTFIFALAQQAANHSPGQPFVVDQQDMYVCWLWHTVRGMAHLD